MLLSLAAFIWSWIPLTAQWNDADRASEAPADTLPAFFSRIAFFQVSLGIPISGSGSVMEDQLRRAGFTRPGYNFGAGRTTPYPRSTGSAWLQFDVGARISEKLTPGISFGVSNNQTAQGNMDSSAFPQLMVLKLSQVYAAPYLRQTVGHGLLQYKLGLGIHRVQFAAPITGSDNRGAGRFTRLGLNAGAALRLFSKGNTTLRLAAELHWLGTVDAGPIDLAAGSAGNDRDIRFPRFRLPLSHANIGLRLEFGQP